LLDAGLSLTTLKSELKKLNLKGLSLLTKKVKRGGISGTKLEIKYPEHNHGRSLKQIKEIINQSSLDNSVKKESLGIFGRLAKVEAKIHASKPSQVHFHELGGIDSLVDIVGTLIAVKKLGLEKIYASVLTLGKGWVKCTHGNLPVPCPATLEILQDIPVIFSDLPGERVTPTGAILISHLASCFSPPPLMKIQQTGYGAGSKDYPDRPNLLRVVIGEEDDEFAEDTVIVIETNMDDISGEVLGYLQEKLLQEGALEAFFTPVQMKKGRPGILLTTLVHPDKFSTITSLIFRESSTLGVRYYETKRKKIKREVKKIDTPWGKVRVKVGKSGNKYKFISPEYEDCQRIAQEKDIPLTQVYEEVKTWVRDKKS